MRERAFTSGFGFSLQAMAKRIILFFVAGLILGACSTNTASTVESNTPYQYSHPNNHAGNAHQHPDIEGAVNYFTKDEVYALNAGMSGITERYIEDVAIKGLGIDALKGLSSIDPAIDIKYVTGPKEHTDLVLLQIAPLNHSAFERDEPHTIDSFRLPDTDNVRPWAELVSNVVNAAKDNSSVLDQTDNEKVLEALFDGMLTGLDIFSRYAGAVEADHNRARREGFGGIGVHFKAEETILGVGKKGFPITSVRKGTPAHDIGLVVGDRIVSVSGHKVSGFKTRKLAAMLRGPVGSNVLVGIMRKYDGAAPTSFWIKRAHIIPETVTSSLDGDILNIRINSFNRLTAAAVRNSVVSVREKIDSGRLHGIVLDLRNNPGGLLMQAVNIADLFLTKGDIVATKGRHPDSLHKYHAGGIDVAKGLPMAILINGDSASSAEVLTGALQDQGRATVIGSTSYGKGSVQTVISLPNSGEITLTWSRLVTPSGYAIHKLGIMPNICAGITSNIPTGAELAKSEATLREWREIGTNFSKKRAAIRKACPDVANNENERSAGLLAKKVVNNREIYTRTIRMSAPVDTARIRGQNN